MSTTKHFDVFQRREECRAALLELRRTRTAKQREAMQLMHEVDSLLQLEARERKRLSNLTTESVQLLHADMAGLVGPVVVVEADGAVVEGELSRDAIELERAAAAV